MYNLGSLIAAMLDPHHPASVPPGFKIKPD